MCCMNEACRGGNSGVECSTTLENLYIRTVTLFVFINHLKRVVSGLTRRYIDTTSVFLAFLCICAQLLTVNQQTVISEHI